MIMEELESIIRLAASVICGFILGLERKSRSQVVGTRTLILISSSSALLSMLSVYMAEHFAITGDPTRIAAGVVSGIGFLGGGAILRQGLNIKGLTSAAIIWTTSALGMAIGAGMYIQSALLLVGTEVLLLLLEKFEGKWFPAVRVKILHLTFENDDNDLNMEKVKFCIEQSGMLISDMNMTHIIESKTTTLHYAVKVPKDAQFEPLIQSLRTLGKLSEFSIGNL